MASPLFGRSRGARRLPRALAAAAVIGIAGMAGVAPASALGVVRVQQHDGSTQVYPGAFIHIIKGKAMIVTSADRVGKLIIDNAACSYVGELLRCLLNGVTLEQNGEKKNLALEAGTLYVNFTDGKLNLPLSSEGLAPQGVVLAYRTERGTYVSLHGTIDELTP